MKLLTKPKLDVNWHARKYRMIALEGILFLLLLFWVNAINTLFPTTTEVVREGDPTLYFYLSLLGIVLLGAMFFVGGYWIANWRHDKNGLETL